MKYVANNEWCRGEVVSVGEYNEWFRREVVSVGEYNEWCRGEVVSENYNDSNVPKPNLVLFNVCAVSVISF